MRRRLSIYLLLAALIWSPAGWWLYRLHHPTSNAAPQRSMNPSVLISEGSKDSDFIMRLPQTKSPPYWEKRRINGVDYYIIPLSA